MSDLAWLSAPTVPFGTKQAMVHHLLRDAILDGRLMPGERLVIDEIARRLQVSIIPVREAMHQLLSEGLVEMRTHVGPVVTGFDDSAASEIFTLLECLELAAARHALTRASEQDLDALEQLVEDMDRESGDRWENLNSRFHLAMCAAARMPRITAAFTRVATDWVRLYRTRLRAAAVPNHARAQKEHRAMLKALRQRDLTALEAVIASHNRAAAKRYQAPA